MLSFAKAIVINASAEAWELGVGQDTSGELKPGLNGYQKLISETIKRRCSKSPGKTVFSCFSTFAQLNLFIDFTADKDMNTTPTWSVMKANVSFHVSKLQTH